MTFRTYTVIIGTWADSDVILSTVVNNVMLEIHCFSSVTS